MGKKTPPPLPPSLSDMLRERIQSCGLSQAEIARLSGVHAVGISRFITGERSFSLESADKIWVALAVHEAESKDKGK